MNWFLLAWRKVAVFRGRAHRTEFWMFALVGVLVWLGLGVLVSYLFRSEPRLGLWVLVGITVASALPLASVSARRLHDTGRSGWIQLISFIPLVGPLVLILLLSVRGGPGENRYGPAPTASLSAAPGRRSDPALRDPRAAERDRLRERFGLSAQPVVRQPTAPVPPAADLAWDGGFLSRQPWMIIAAFAVLEVVGVTGLGSWIARWFGFQFSWLTPVAGVIYGAAGFHTARAAGSPALAGAIVAVVDWTTLFLLSGIGPVPELPRGGPAFFLSALVVVGICGTLASMAGGWLATRGGAGETAGVGS